MMIRRSILGGALSGLRFGCGDQGATTPSDAGGRDASETATRARGHVVGADHSRLIGAQGDSESDGPPDATDRDGDGAPSP